MRPATTLALVLLLLVLVGAAVAQLVFNVGGGTVTPTKPPAVVSTVSATSTLVTSTLVTSTSVPA